jgi:hypothetical protein
MSLARRHGGSTRLSDRRIRHEGRSGPGTDSARMGQRFEYGWTEHQVTTAEHAQDSTRGRLGCHCGPGRPIARLLGTGQRYQHEVRHA